MSLPSPTSLDRLLRATDVRAREDAWVAFLADHSALIVRVVRRWGGDHDAVMDRYAFVVDALRRDDYQRLHTWTVDGKGEFAVWLVVVVRRLSLDFMRQRYGRQQGTSVSSSERHATRRQLVDLVGDELALASVAGDGQENPEEFVRAMELRDALQRALVTLDPADRLLLRLRFEDGLSVPLVAKALGVASPFPLYRRLEKLLGALRKALERAGVHDASP